MGQYRKTVAALSPRQKEYFKALQEYKVIMASGVAGTGKSFVAASEACYQLQIGKIEKIILTRPMVTTEKFGFLPGDIQEKTDPFLRPLFDVLFERLGVKAVKTALDNLNIEIAPLAFLRGRTLGNSFIILDEAQNSTVEQMKMFLTRLGENVTCVVTGDVEQSDLSMENGFTWALRKLEHCPVVKIIRFTHEDVVRSALVKELMKFL